MDGLFVSRALLAADELGLVELLRGGPKGTDELAQATNVHARSLRRVMRALATVDLFVIQADGRFALGPLAAKLRVAARMGVESYRSMDRILDSLRTGKPTFSQVYNKEMWEYVAEDRDRVVRFDEAMAAISQAWVPTLLEAYDFSGINTVLDIGGGRGTFLTAFLEAYPSARGVLFDQPHVISAAEKLLAERGVADRCKAIGGNFLESIPPDADAYTVSNVLADWPDEQVLQIFKNCHRAMRKDARFVMNVRLMPPREHPNHQKIAFFDLYFLVMLGGCIRTQEEYEQLLDSAGFSITRVIPTRSEFTVIESSPNK